jgi:hypothetical protein
VASAIFVAPVRFTNGVYLLRCALVVALLILLCYAPTHSSFDA